MGRNQHPDETSLQKLVQWRSHHCTKCKLYSCLDSLLCIKLCHLLPLMTSVSGADSLQPWAGGIRGSLSITWGKMYLFPESERIRWCLFACNKYSSQVSSTTVGSVTEYFPLDPSQKQCIMLLGVIIQFLQLWSQFSYWCPVTKLMSPKFMFLAVIYFLYEMYDGSKMM